MAFLKTRLVVRVWNQYLLHSVSNYCNGVLGFSLVYTFETSMFWYWEPIFVHVLRTSQFAFVGNQFIWACSFVIYLCSLETNLCSSVVCCLSACVGTSLHVLGTRLSACVGKQSACVCVCILQEADRRAGCTADEWLPGDDTEKVPAVQASGPGWVWPSLCILYCIPWHSLHVLHCQAHTVLSY